MVPAWGPPRGAVERRRCCGGRAEVVEANLRQASTNQQRLEGASDQVACINGFTDRDGEDQVQVIPCRTESEAFFGLPGSVLRQGINGRSIQGSTPRRWR